MRPALVLALVVLPLVELYVIVVVAMTTTVPFTLALLFAISLGGAVLLKREGVRAWRRFRDALAAGRPPAREVSDGALILLGGALLLTPGFVTDAVGLLIVLPPTRALLRRWLVGWVAARLVAGGPRTGRRAPADPDVVDGEIVEDRRPEG